MKCASIYLQNAKAVFNKLTACCLFALVFSFAACGGGGGGDDSDDGATGGDTESGLDISLGGDSFCLEACTFSNDGECDDGGAGSISISCVLGTDCNDCGPRPAPAPSPENGLSCSDDCVFSADGECDDGSDPNSPFVCPPATDCTDCGPRNLVAEFGAFSRIEVLSRSESVPVNPPWAAESSLGQK